MARVGRHPTAWTRGLSWGIWSILDLVLRHLSPRGLPTGALFWCVSNAVCWVGAVVHYADVSNTVCWVGAVVHYADVSNTVCWVGAVVHHADVWVMLFVGSVQWCTMLMSVMLFDGSVQWCIVSNAVCWVHAVGDGENREYLLLGALPGQWKHIALRAGHVNKSQTSPVLILYAAFRYVCFSLFCMPLVFLEPRARAAGWDAGENYPPALQSSVR